MGSLPPDSLRVDAYGVSEDELLPRADEAIETLLRLLRWKSGQWWITRSHSALMQFGPLGFPVSPKGDAIMRATRHSAPTGVFPPFGHERLVSDSIWVEALAALEAGGVVPVHQLLLSDAYFFTGIHEYREAVLAASAACDHIKEKVVGELWLRRNPGKVYDDDRRNDVLRNWDLPRHLDLKLQNHFGRSFRAENEPAWSAVNQLWEARNNVAHGAKNVFGDPPKKVDRPVMADFLHAAAECIAWLEGLR